MGSRKHQDGVDAFDVAGMCRAGRTGRAGERAVPCVGPESESSRQPGSGEMAKDG